jgi:hypothetical protein
VDGTRTDDLALAAAAGRVQTQQADDVGCVRVEILAVPRAVQTLDPR